jgi:hypothetical protein
MHIICRENKPQAIVTSGCQERTKQCIALWQFSLLNGLTIISSPDHLGIKWDDRQKLALKEIFKFFSQFQSLFLLGLEAHWEKE